VISHLAATREIPYNEGEVKVEILQNPSHLEVSSSLLDLLSSPHSVLSRCQRGVTWLPSDLHAFIRHSWWPGEGLLVQDRHELMMFQAVNPVALGVTRAKQMSLLKSSPQDCKLGDRVMCVQLHGDAAFAGQGIVAESLGLSGLPHYGSGGTIHVIVKWATPRPFDGRAELTFRSNK
jgi:2-oxoglutarate dehydrogenase complex dehydrogenase (E1) component-like enzyme